MPNIVTITLNPALDKSISVPELVPEKKLRARSSKVEPGGGGINISRALKKLGVDSEAIILSGGYTGKALETLLEKEGVKFSAIETENDTRENFVVFDEDKKLQYRFGMPGESVSEKELGSLMQTIGHCFHADYVVVSGSLPSGTSVAVFHEIALIAAQLNAKLIIDTSGEGLKAAVKEGLFLIKPNLRELASLVGKEWIDVADVVPTARQVIAAGGCKTMVVSMGAEGAGDSMVAGMLAALTKGWGWKEILQYGVAAGSAATLHKGTELCKLEDTERIFEQMKQN